MHRLIRRFPVFGLLCLGLGLSASPDAEALVPQAEFKTNLGTFVIELYPDKAPRSVANFVQYVNEGFYSGTIFHRVIANFMIQGGGHLPDLSRKPTRPPIEIESRNGLKNDAGWVCG